MIEFTIPKKIAKLWMGNFSKTPSLSLHLAPELFEKLHGWVSSQKVRVKLLQQGTAAP